MVIGTNRTKAKMHMHSQNVFDQFHCNAQIKLSYIHYRISAALQKLLKQDVKFIWIFLFWISDSAHQIHIGNPLFCGSAVIIPGLVDSSFLNFCLGWAPRFSCLLVRRLSRSRQILIRFISLQKRFFIWSLQPSQYTAVTFGCCYYYFQASIEYNTFLLLILLVRSFNRWFSLVRLLFSWCSFSQWIADALLLQLHSRAYVQ